MSHQILSLLALFLCLVAPLRGLSAAEKPNILFIAIDDLRPELRCYGNEEVKTPNLDQLATTGVRFDRAYTQYAICGPSRACMMTGLRPDTLKIEEIDTYFRDTVPEVVTLPQHFKANGYESVYVGKVFHGKQTDDALSWSRAIKVPGGKGSEYQLPESLATIKKRREEAAAKYGEEAQLQGMSNGPAWEGADADDSDYPDGRTADAAIATLRELKGKPFFFGVGFIKPHLPFVAPKKYFDLYDPATLTLTDTPTPPKDGPTIARHSSFELRTRTLVPTSGPIDEPTSRELLRAYYACASFVDAQIGRVLAELDALGLRENTIIVVWGDHGWHLGEYGIWGKATNYEVATRVPLIVSAPKMAAKGRGSKALVEFVDVYPSLCDLAGLPLPKHLEGSPPCWAIPISRGRPLPSVNFHRPPCASGLHDRSPPPCAAPSSAPSSPRWKPSSRRNTAIATLPISSITTSWATASAPTATATPPGLIAARLWTSHSRKSSTTTTPIHMKR